MSSRIIEVLGWRDTGKVDQWGEPIKEGLVESVCSFCGYFWVTYMPKLDAVAIGNRFYDYEYRPDLLPERWQELLDPTIDEIGMIDI